MIDSCGTVHYTIMLSISAPYLHAVYDRTTYVDPDNVLTRTQQNCAPTQEVISAPAQCNGSGSFCEIRSDNDDNTVLKNVTN